jgi:hypothetical protein
MNVLNTAWKLEAKLSEQLDRVAERVRTNAPLEPLEVVHAVVESVAHHIEPGGRGAFLFPYTHVKVTLLAPAKEARARLAAVLDGEPTLTSRVGERLCSAGCVAADVDVRVSYAVERGTHWTHPAFHLDLQRAPERSQAAHASRAASAVLRLTVEHGSADKTSYTFNGGRVNLGRCRDLRDNSHRLIRTNHVALEDGDAEVNASVSRQHAHVAFDSGAGHYRVCDDGSAHGTNVVRAGRLISVPPGSRGIRLQTGDVIVLGEARVRVTIPD